MVVVVSGRVVEVVVVAALAGTVVVVGGTVVVVTGARVVVVTSAGVVVGVAKLEVVMVVVVVAEPSWPLPSLWSWSARAGEAGTSMKANDERSKTRMLRFLIGARVMRLVGRLMRGARSCSVS